MKSLIAVLFALVLAGVKAGVIAPVAVAPIITTIPLHQSSQYHSQDALGQYAYGYANELAAKNEIKTLDGQTVGAYSYVDGDGKIQNVQYRSSPASGFQVSATNLPVAPALPEITPLKHPEPVSDTAEVVEARSKHLEAFKAVEDEAKKLAAAQPAAVIKSAPPAQLNVIQPAAPILATPAFSYSYGINHNGFLAYSLPVGGAHLLTTYHTPALITAPLNNDISQQIEHKDQKLETEIIAARSGTDSIKTQEKQ